VAEIKKRKKSFLHLCRQSFSVDNMTGSRLRVRL